MPLAVSVLKLHPRAGRRVGVEPHLDLAGAGMVGLYGPLRADIPAEHHPVGRVERQNARPPALAKEAIAAAAESVVAKDLVAK